VVAEKHQIDRVVELPILDARDRRTFKRTYVVVSGQVSDTKELQLNCVILDLSANGARVRFDAPLKSDQIIKIKLAGAVEFDVEVAWINGVFAGLRFLEPPEKIANILAGILPDGCLEF
jgi:hypothetical protein